MPLNLTQEQIAAANAESVTTFFLYEIYYNPNNWSQVLRYTNWQPESSHSAFPDYLWRGEVYKTIPIKHGDITQATDGKISDITITLGNADRVIQDYIESEDFDIMSGKVKIIQVFKGVGDAQEMTFRIKKAQCKKDVATFTLSIGIDVLGYELPCRKIMSRFCWWAFRDTDCKYNGHNEKMRTYVQKGTSTTSMHLEPSVKTITTQTGIVGIGAGKLIRIVSQADEDVWMEGPSTGYSDTTLTVKVTKFRGTGTLSAWDIKRVDVTTSHVVDADCDRTFDDCKSKNNLENFGGFPGVLNERFYF